MPSRYTVKPPGATKGASMSRLAREPLTVARTGVDTIMLVLSWASAPLAVLNKRAAWPSTPVDVIEPLATIRLGLPSTQCANQIG